MARSTSASSLLRSLIVTSSVLATAALAEPQAPAPSLENTGNRDEAAPSESRANAQRDDAEESPALATDSAAAAAAATAEPSKGEPSKGEPVEVEQAALPAWVSLVHFSGFVDVNVAANLNAPADGANFIAGTGTTAKRSNELALNLAELEVAVDPAPVGGKLQLVFGTGTQVVHAGEPPGIAIGSNAFDALYQAYLTFKVPYVDGLLVDAGIFSSHVGFESFFAKDNWNYTRGYLCEFVPYYQTGVRVTYALPFAPGLSVQLQGLNGWQVIGDNNNAKSFGAQIAYTSDILSGSLNGWFGPELAGDDKDIRALGDLVLVLHPAGFLWLGASADLGNQQLPGGDHATWWGASGYARIAPLPWLAVAARGEYFSDPDNGISGTAQNIGEGTLTVEVKPIEQVIVRLEGRYDVSSAPVFGTSKLAADGSVIRTTTEPLIVLAAIASF